MVKDLIIYTPMYVTFFWTIVLLLSNTKKNKAKRLLSVFMIFAFLVYLSHALFFKQFEKAYLIFDSIYILASLSVYPLYYWYIKILTVETGYTPKNLRLFIPAVILSVVTALIYILMKPQERFDYLHHFLLKNDTQISETILMQSQKIVFITGRIVFAIQVIFFLIFGRKLVIQYNKRVANFYSNLESKTIVWVNFLLSSFVITSIMSVVFNIIGRYEFLDSPLLLLIPSLIFSVMLFSIGFLGYMQNHSVLELVSDESKSIEKNLKDFNHVQLKEQLLNLFGKDKIYKNSDLKITQVSSKLQTNRTYVSNIINSDFSCSFSDFVNKYRIEEAKKMLTDDLLKNYSMNYISEAVGFGSLNTFIRVFKEKEGVTPGRFRDLQKSKPDRV